MPADGPPFDHPLADDSLVVGRSSTSNLPLADRFLSRQHLRIFRSGDRYLVEDLGSRNGTLLNGELVRQPTPLRPGDVIKASGSLLRLQEAGRRSSTVATDPETDSGRHTVFRRASDLLDRDAGDVAVDAASLRRYAERLKLLHEVHVALSQSIALADLLELILDRAFVHLRPEHGAIFLTTPGGELVRAARRPDAGAADAFVASRSLEQEVIGKGLAALVLDARTDERFAQAQSILSSGVRSLIAAPLLTPEGALGMIALDSRIVVHQFDESDLELLVGLAAVAALRIRNVALAEEAAERRRLEEELALARRIQVALLPASLPRLAGWDLHAGNVPSRGVSGDYYKVVERLGGRECALMVADVSGKGMAASLLTACLEALSASPIEDGLPPDDIFARLSRLLHARTPPEKYATAFLGALDVESGDLRFANAGHNPALVVRRGGEVERHGATGPPLGLIALSAYRLGEVALAPGDLLVLYTDGIVEAVDPDDEEYGLDRFAAACAGLREDDLPAVAGALERDLAAFVRGVPYGDDRTLVLLRRRP